MRRVALTIPLYLPSGVYEALRRTRATCRRRMGGSKRLNLLGDRDIEWSWVLAHIPSSGGKALDFGSGGSPLALTAAERGYEVTAIDLEPLDWPYVHSRLRVIRGDLLETDLPSDAFDLIINCSTVEHVGVMGRYGVRLNRGDGDLEAMARLRLLMKTGAVMLLTVPLGQDEVFRPLGRVYGSSRLPQLLDGFSVEEAAYWRKDPANRWVRCEQEDALATRASFGSWDPLRNICALGCFVLQR